MLAICLTYYFITPSNFSVSMHGMCVYTGDRTYRWHGGEATILHSKVKYYNLRYSEYT